MAAFSEAVQLWRTLEHETEDVSIGLNDLADAEFYCGDLDVAERDYREALRIAKAVEYDEGIANYTSNLAVVMMERENWADAEVFARKGLSLSEEIGRQDLIGWNCHMLAKALLRQGKRRRLLFTPSARLRS